MAKLLLIESPGKLRKLSQILGPGWTVKASMGHVRELANDGEDALGFDLARSPGNHRIDCRYVPRNPRAKKVLSELRQAAKSASQVYIATDPDREGETIGWHIQQALRLKNPQRVVYSEITAAAVKKAIAQPTCLNQDLIAAGRARDCLDKLVGYKGSRHVVWPLQNGAKSMGRVQSATLHLICQREREILAFKPEDYWSIWSQYGEGFKAFYCKDPSKKKVVPIKSAESKTAAKGAKGSKSAQPDSPESDRVTSQAEADRILAIARSHLHIVISVEGKTTHQSPPPPFITSSLQQSAGARLKLSPEGTMKLAQALYEAGHITYMRTDSVMLAEPFKADVRAYLQQHDPQNLPQSGSGSKRTRHKNSANAQAAHEAIRPTKVGQTPAALANQLSGDQARLYELIWNRAVASLCAPVRLRKTRVVTQSGPERPSGPADLAYWEARGQVVEFPGYTRYWNNLKADSRLPELKIGQILTLVKAQADKKQTQPPPRYTEPKLIQLMERKGIGRPSTYAPTLKTLRDRTYVTLVKSKLQPTALGMNLDGALEQLLPDLIQPEFTAQMEAKLDAIAQGQENWEHYLTHWYQTYFSPAITQAQRNMGQVLTQQANAPAFRPAAETAKPKSNAASRAPKRRKGAAIAKSPSSGENNRNPSQQEQNRRSQSRPKRSTQNSQLPCPKCNALLKKIPSKSKKLQANHFLKCESPGCETVMFWNKRKQAYEQPASQRSPDPANFTHHPCPSCGALLERYSYRKEGQDKTMLRCSIPENRKGKCKDVAYFHSRDEYWSPKYGVLGTETKPAAPTKATPRSAKRNTKSRSAASRQKT